MNDELGRKKRNYVNQEGSSFNESGLTKIDELEFFQKKTAPHKKFLSLKLKNKQRTVGKSLAA